MKTQITNSAPFVYFVIAILFSIWANNSFGQNVDNLPTKDFYCFKYDGLTEYELYPASISIEKLETDEVERKTYYYGNILPNGIGLPSIEDVDINRCKEIFESLESYLVHPDWNGHWADYLTHLIKDETKGNDTAHLIKDDTKSSNA